MTDQIALVENDGLEKLENDGRNSSSTQNSNPST